MVKGGEVSPCSVLHGHSRIPEPTVIEGLWTLLKEYSTPSLDEIINYLAVIHEIHTSTTVLHEILMRRGVANHVLAAHVGGYALMGAGGRGDFGMARWACSSPVWETIDNGWV